MIRSPRHRTLGAFTAILLGFGSAHAAAASKGSSYFTFDGPVGPPGKPGTPVLQSITAEYNVVNRNGRHVDVRPNFHFIAPMGNAVELHRQLLETDSALPNTNIRSEPIHIPADLQRQGAVVRGGWPCGKSTYHVTLKVWLEDANGNSGNALKYTIHCNEQLLF